MRPSMHSIQKPTWSSKQSAPNTVTTLSCRICASSRPSATTARSELAGTLSSSFSATSRSRRGSHALSTRPKLPRPISATMRSGPHDTGLAGFGIGAGAGSDGGDGAGAAGTTSFSRSAAPRSRARERVAMVSSSRARRWCDGSVSQLARCPVGSLSGRPPPRPAPRAPGRANHPGCSSRCRLRSMIPASFRTARRTPTRAAFAVGFPRAAAMSS